MCEALLLTTKACRAVLCPSAKTSVFKATLLCLFILTDCIRRDKVVHVTMSYSRTMGNNNEGKWGCHKDSSVLFDRELTKFKYVGGEQILESENKLAFYKFNNHKIRNRKQLPLCCLRQWLSPIWTKQSLQNSSRIFM